MLRWVSFCMIALAMTVGAASAAAAPGIAPLPQVLTQTRSATYAAYAKRAGARVASAQAFSAMRTYVLQRYTGVSVEHSFVASSGGIVDCVPFADQPGIRGRPVERSTPPPVGGAPKQPAPGAAQQQPGATALGLTLRPTDRDRFGNARYCAPGFIPLERVTLDVLVRFPTLALFFAKTAEPSLDAKDTFSAGRRAPPRPSASGDPHYYADGQQTVDNLGAHSWLNVWNPTVAPNQMSLSQIWVLGESESPRQTIEAGWQVYPSRWHTTEAVLFIYYTTDNYAANSGCYNLECAGFVQVANNVDLGGGFTHYSTTGGAQWGFDVQYQRDAANGNWWLFLGPSPWIAVGYYPHALFGAGQLARNGTRVVFGGEDTGDPAALQMGSGALAAQGFGEAAFQKTIFYIDMSLVGRWAALTSIEIPGPPCYTTSLGSGGAWGTWLYFGGPSCH
jgi:hypothetical protein